MTKNLLIKDSTIQHFTNPEFGEVRVLEEDGKPLFCGSDVAKALGYARPNDALKLHCRYAVKHSTPHPQSLEKTINMLFIPEGDIYRLIIKSKLPSAEKFERWVMDEVLPQIRKTGGYIPLSPTDTEKDILAKAILIADETIKEKDRLISKLQPKAEAYDEFLSSSGCVSLNKAAKSIGKGRNRMNAFLRENQVLFKEDKDNIPYQRFINNGYFKINHIVSKDGRLHTVTRVSPKGIVFINNLYKKKEVA